ncbi:hypothetical protein JCM6882_004083 [Rhodosporidiobolus microsporus]
MSTPHAKHQGLYALQLPPSLLASLRPRQLVIPEHHPLYRPSTLPSSAPDASSPLAAPSSAAAEALKRDDAPIGAEASGEGAAAEGGAFKCALTGARFDSLQALRDHYKSDWYRYNVKLKLRGERTPVSEGEFERRVGDLSDSLSGSDSSSPSSQSSSPSDADLSDADSDSRLSRLLRRHHLPKNGSTGAGGAAAGGGGDAGDEADELAINAGGARSALLWFDVPPSPPSASAAGEGQAKEGAGEEEKEEQAKPTQYGVYRAILPQVGGEKRSSPSEGADALRELASLQLSSPSPPSSSPAEDEGESRKWTLLMFGGGHFAGMVVDLEPKLVSKGKGKEKDREVQVLERKTFHRYTTRRKQGGGQGAYDAAGGKAKSIGAQIRRHNEQALTDEVRALLLSWQPLIQSSELVFLRCSRSNYRTFFGYEGSPLDRYKKERGEGRIRGFGFPTRRPTLAELLRAFLELTRVKTTHLSATELASLDAAYLASITPRPAVTAPPKPAPQKEKKEKEDKPRLTKLEELERDRWMRLVEMVKKGRLDALSAFLDKYGPELESGVEGSSASSASSSKPWGTLPPWMDDARRTPTLLHVASAADQPAVVRWLLEVKRADPTLHLPPSSSSSSSPPSSAAAEHAAAPPPASAQPQTQTPYDLAPSRPTRNQFRFLAHAHPGWWDWLGTGVGGARVPSGLDEEKERERERREEEKRERVRVRAAEREREEEEGREAERREKEERERREREEREAARSKAGKAGPQRLGGGGGAVLGARRDSERGALSEVQRARVEREERARAAEARLRRLGG